MPHATRTKWVYFAKAEGNRSERAFTVSEYVEMCQQAGVPFSDTRLYNAIRDRIVPSSDPVPPHKGKRVFYDHFCKWRGYDPLEMIRVNECVEGMARCPSCNMAIEVFWRYCPSCGRPNRYASLYNEQDFTAFHTSTEELQRTG